jgi:hypothetical protein
MIQEIFESISGITIYPIIAFFLFFTIFVLIVFWTFFRASKKYIQKMENLPFDSKDSSQSNGD